MPFSWFGGGGKWLIHLPNFARIHACLKIYPSSLAPIIIKTVRSIFLLALKFPYFLAESNFLPY